MHFLLSQPLSILRALEATILALLCGVGMGDLVQRAVRTSAWDVVGGDGGGR